MQLRLRTQKSVVMSEADFLCQWQAVITIMRIGDINTEAPRYLILHQGQHDVMPGVQIRHQLREASVAICCAQLPCQLCSSAVQHAAVSELVNIKGLNIQTSSWLES